MTSYHYFNNYIIHYFHLQNQRPGSESPANPSQSPVPMAVKEVLSTKKGTAFFVLTVAGEHGITKEEVKGQEGGTSSFLTEVGIEDVEMVPGYVQTVTIPVDLFDELRKV